MWLNSTSLLASVLGAVCFGRLMDLFGRKAMYGVEVLLLTVGAVLSALSHNVGQLIVFRALVGFGVGGDYATSAVITSEYANRRDRGGARGHRLRHAGLRSAGWPRRRRHPAERRRAA